MSTCYHAYFPVYLVWFPWHLPIWLEESLDPNSRADNVSNRSLGKFRETFSNIIGVLRIPMISTLVVINFLFLMAFSMMHGTFILFTAMSIDSGGLGLSEMENGWIFAFIGLLGVIIQGGLIGPLTDRFGMGNLMMIGTILWGGDSQSSICTSGGILADTRLLRRSSNRKWSLSPTHSSLLTLEANRGGHDLGS